MLSAFQEDARARSDAPHCLSRKKQQYLNGLELCIRQSEMNMETLLRAFDLDLFGEPLLNGLPDNLFPASNYPEVVDSDSANDLQLDLSDYVENLSRFSEIEAELNSQLPSLENLLLPTPICLENKSDPNRRNPLLFPSIPAETLEDSDISDLSLSKPSVQSDVYNTKVGNLDPFVGLPSLDLVDPNVFPPTPPPTAQLADLKRFSSDPSFSNCRKPPHSSLTVGANSALAAGDSHVGATRHHNSLKACPLGTQESCYGLENTSFMRLPGQQSDDTTSSGESSFIFTIQTGQRAVQQAGTLLPPSVLQHLCKVFREPREVEEDLEVKSDPRTAGSIFRMAFLEHHRPDLCSTSSRWLPHLSGLAIYPSFHPTQDRGMFRSSADHISFRPLHHPTLEQEFTELLTKQAVSDDRMANQLRGLAKRLDQLAGSRRKLAKLVDANCGHS
jgi:hypothetical protein